MNGYIRLKVNSVMGEEIRKTIDVLSDMLVKHPLKEEESECLEMARFYLSRVNRETIFLESTLERKSQTKRISTWQTSLSLPELHG